VGLGETDLDLVELFLRLREMQVLSYLFCFNPEPDSRLGGHPKSSLTRWRRIQLVKDLIETGQVAKSDLRFDPEGALVGLRADPNALEQVVGAGEVFMTNGCPGEKGEPGCTRPYGSYRPSEQFRDFPFKPSEQDMCQIREELALNEILEGVN